MKKFLSCVFVFITALLVSSCGNGSSGTTMLNLDVRIIPHEDCQEVLNRPEIKQKYEDLSNLFTVLPGPYEFTWEELKNQDNALGYEQCATKLKIKLRLNKTLKSIYYLDSNSRPLSEEKIMEKLLQYDYWYSFEMFNSEGKIPREVSEENDDEHYMLFLSPEIANVWGADGKIGFKKNKDGVLDFYHFLTSAPGTEFDLILDCGIQMCRDIEDIIAYNKGLNIEIRHTAVWEYIFRYE